MAFNIESFKSRGPITGGARPTLFAVRFTVVPSGVPDATADMEFNVTSSQLPASILGTVPVFYMGRQVNFAGDRTYQPWTISIRNEEDFRLRDMFEGWHNKINAIVSNRQDSPTNDLVDYKVDAEVLQYGKAGPGDDSGVIRAYKFVGIFPTFVSPIQVDWEAQNRFETFDVELTYDYWVPSDTSTLGVGYNPVVAPDSNSSF